MSNEQKLRMEAEKNAEQSVGRPKFLPPIIAFSWTASAYVVVVFYARFASQPLDVAGGIIVSLLAGGVGFIYCGREWKNYEKCVDWHFDQMKYKNGKP